MLFVIIVTILLAVRCDDSKYVLHIPVPLDFPNRNDRADQCWLRIEDLELTETLTVYCHIAHAFLRSFVHDYNNRKMIEDDVDVSLWIEQPRTEDVLIKDDAGYYNIVDWKITTVKDPMTRQRLYVTKNADCRIIMYSRESMTNYKVDCDKVLYYVNVKMNGATLVSQVKVHCNCLLCLEFPCVIESDMKRSARESKSPTYPEEFTNINGNERWTLVAKPMAAVTRKRTADDFWM